jgi:NADH-quinone oxidoreductase subunit J
MIVEIIILSVLMLAALWTVMTRSILRSAIGLAFVSVMLTYIMFRLSSPIAAVFELSVCTGLISVVFISTITLTFPLSKEEVLQHMKERLSRFWYLPLILILVGLAFSLAQVKLNLTMPPPEVEQDVRNVLWILRPLDLAGQVIMLLTGVYGVLILFRQVRKK